MSCYYLFFDYLITWSFELICCCTRVAFQLLHLCYIPILIPLYFICLFHPQSLLHIKAFNTKFSCPAPLFFSFILALFYYQTFFVDDYTTPSPPLPSLPFPSTLFSPFLSSCLHHSLVTGCAWERTVAGSTPAHSRHGKTFLQTLHAGVLLLVCVCVWVCVCLFNK